MTDLAREETFINLRKQQILRFCIVFGMTMFWTIKAVFTKSYMGNNSFLDDYIVFSNLTVMLTLAGTFIIAKKRRHTYAEGEISARISNYHKANIYWITALEICSVLLMLGFIFWGRVYFVLEAVILYALYAYYFPTKKRLQRDLELNNNQ